MLARIEKPLHDAGVVRADVPPADLGALAWVLLIVIPGKEKLAADWLKNANVSAYWPNYLRQVAVGRGARKAKGGRRATLCSIMPGYLLMAVRASSHVDPWDVVHQTPGVVGYVRDSRGFPATLTSKDVHDIREIEARENMPRPKDEPRRYKAGDKVRFADRLLGSWPVGTVGALAEDGRIRVDVSLLGRVVPIWVFAHQIEAM